MHLGMFMQPVHPPSRNYTDVLEEDRQAVILADKLGFSEVWVGEHMTATVEPITSPLSFFSSLLQETSSIKFGTGVICMPQIHPAIVAAQVAQFDHISRGRFLMGIGPGSLSSDTQVFDTMDAAARARMVQESIDMILTLWREDPPYDLKGEFWNIQLQQLDRYEWGVGQLPKPYQQPHPPIAISIVSPKSKTATIAGEKGWIPISGNFIQPRHVATHLPAYLEGCANAGRPADPSVWRAARSIFVADDAAQAEDYVADPNGALSFYFGYLESSYRARNALFMMKPDESVADEDVTTANIVDSMSTRGTPAQVLDQLIAFRDEIGPFGTLLSVAHDWDQPALWQRSMHLLAEEVMPRFAQHCSATQAAAE